MRDRILKIMGFIIVFVLWDIISFTLKDPALPRLYSIFKSLIELLTAKSFYMDMYSSLEIIIKGIGIAFILGFVIGLLIFQIDSIKKMITPIVEAIRVIPALTLFPLLISTIGIGVGSRIFIICWTAWPSVLIQTIYALNNIEQEIIEAGINSGASNWRILFQIRLPLAKHQIMSGVKIGVGGGWIGLIASEMLGATGGLGYSLMWASQSFEYSKVYALIIVISFLGFMMNILIDKIDEKFCKY